MANLFIYIIFGKGKIPFRDPSWRILYLVYTQRTSLITIETWMKYQGLILESLLMATLQLQPLMFDKDLVCAIYCSILPELQSLFYFTHLLELLAICSHVSLLLISTSCYMLTFVRTILGFVMKLVAVPLLSKNK